MNRNRRIFRPPFVLLCSLALALFASPFAFANGPGKGEITVHPGHGIVSLHVAYNLTQFFGEAMVDGVFEWRAQSGYKDELPPQAVVWLEVSNSMGSGYIRISPTIPKSGAGFGMNMTGSPQWNALIAQGYSGTNGERYVSAQTAKQFWIKGFRVVNAFLAW